MDGVAQNILLEAHSVLISLKAMFVKAVNEEMVDDSIKLGAAISRIQRDAYQVDAQSEAVARGTAASLKLAHMHMQKPQAQDGAEAMLSRLGDIASLKDKITGGKVGIRPPGDHGAAAGGTEDSE